MKLKLGWTKNAIAASLPTRERGLKYSIFKSSDSVFSVAPYAGAWIEIMAIARVIRVIVVAPYAGAWIEICFIMSGIMLVLVAPYAGAWIEMEQKSKQYP